jgi:phosphoribosylformylglycinamidine synthase subunit PurS
VGGALRSARARRGDRRRRIRGPRRYSHGGKARVLIRPKEGILDPQGKAVERALPALGFEGIGDVRVGRLVELEAADPSRLDELCEKLLANPLVEDYEIEVENGEPRRPRTRSRGAGRQ